MLNEMQRETRDNNITRITRAALELGRTEAIETLVDLGKRIDRFVLELRGETEKFDKPTCGYSVRHKSEDLATLVRDRLEELIRAEVSEYVGTADEHEQLADITSVEMVVDAELRDELQELFIE